MKKLIALLLSAILIFSLYACSNSSTNSNDTPNNAEENIKATVNAEENIKATVINKQGVTEQLTAKELSDIDEVNPIKFENNYWCAKVTVTGEIKEIGGLSSINGSNYNWTLVIEGGECDWFIGDNTYNTSTVTKDYIANLSIGDTVEISGEIVGVSFSFGRVDISNNTISVKKK